MEPHHVDRFLDEVQRVRQDFHRFVNAFEWEMHRIADGYDPNGCELHGIKPMAARKKLPTKRVKEGK